MTSGSPFAPDGLEPPSVDRTTDDRVTTVVRTNGIRLRVTQDGIGHGRPLLLVNGIGATGDLFDPLRLHLPDRETIAFDMPGVGGSSTPRRPLSMRRLAGVVSDMVAELGHERVDVLGLSWGGGVAQQLARSHPETVDNLVLSATMPGLGGVPGRPAAMAILLTPTRYKSVEYLRRVAPTLYGGSIDENLHLLDEHAAQRSRRRPTDLGYLYQLMAIQGWSSLPWLHRVGHRTLVLAGDDDPIIPVANGRILARRLPQGRLHVVEGGGHLHLFTRPIEMAGVISDFLDAVR